MQYFFQLGNEPRHNLLDLLLLFVDLYQPLFGRILFAPQLMAVAQAFLGILHRFRRDVADTERHHPIHQWLLDFCHFFVQLLFCLIDAAELFKMQPLLLQFLNRGDLIAQLHLAQLLPFFHVTVFHLQQPGAQFAAARAPPHKQHINRDQRGNAQRQNKTKRSVFGVGNTIHQINEQRHDGDDRAE
ncbi:MAG: hypothetical protein ALAOOOJD_03122 [bacterium]|nr:hypothetical protein [bacterium]